MATERHLLARNLRKTKLLKCIRFEICNTAANENWKIKIAVIMHNTAKKGFRAKKLLRVWHRGRKFEPSERLKISKFGFFEFVPKF